MFQPSSHTKVDLFVLVTIGLERVLHMMGVEVIIVTNEKLSSQEEFVQDLISIIHVCSCRVYGLRKCWRMKSYEKSISNRD